MNVLEGQDMIRTAVIGAAGYAGIEVVRFVLGHPAFKLTIATSKSEAGMPLASLYPALLGSTDMVFSPHDIESVAHSCELVFLAVPHTAALAIAPALIEAGVAVIDLSADFRLKDPAVYEQWYHTAHTAPSLLEEAVYGLPEINREHIRARALAYNDHRHGRSSLVACPGCYPTAAALALYPALDAGIVQDGHIVINALSGISGAGRSLSEKTKFCTANESAGAYAATTHRHTPEIEQTLTQIASRPVQVVFTPHLIPLTRGLLVTATLPIESGLDEEGVVQLYRAQYADEPFVSVLPRHQMPVTSSVVGTNRAQVGMAFDDRTGMLVVSCAIDNLDKGAASQAVQCANIIFGLNETAGLTTVSPVV